MKTWGEYYRLSGRELRSYRVGKKYGSGLFAEGTIGADVDDTRPLIARSHLGTHFITVDLAILNPPQLKARYG